MTQKESVKVMCKSILSRLENDKAIVFPPRLRQIVADEIYGLIKPMIMTEEDLRERAIQKMGARAELLQDSTFTESEQYKAAKAVVRSGFGDDVLNGFYFIKPVKDVATTISHYLMRSSHIDDVFETDEDLEKGIVEFIKRFNPSHAH